jgi:hypothetical protein
MPNSDNKTKSSEIIEVKNISEVKDRIQHLAGKILFIFDFDNVISWLGDDVIVGTDPWFEKHLKTGIENLGDLTAAEMATLEIFMDAHNTNPVQAVEAQTIKFIQELQQNKKCVIALTSRSGKYLAQLTRAQANALGICFSNSHQYQALSADLTHLGPHCYVDQGYFYTGGKNKGTILEAGLKAIGIAIEDYDHVVFVDDDILKVKQLQEVVAGKTNFIGFRYGFLDEHLNKVKEIIRALNQLHTKI